MNMGLKEEFLNRWREHFGGAELPIACWYADDAVVAERPKPATAHRCLIADLANVRKGNSLRFDAAAIGCSGGKRYLGFAQDVPPDFEHFLSCGIPGKLEGIRFKKSPELVKEYEAQSPSFTAPGRYIVFRRWDKLGEADDPQVVIFFAPPDVLSGLYTLAGFDEADLNAVYCPFCAGCGSIVKYPFLEKDASCPRAVLGMFDVSARPFVPGSTLSFAVPMKKFAAMINNMEESFLITESWKTVMRRMGRG